MTFFLRRLKGNYIARTTVAITGILLLVKVLGYFEKIIVAYYWGTGTEADVYYAVTAILIGIALLFREVTEPGFMNILTRAEQEKGRREAQKAYVTIFWLIVLLACTITVIQMSLPEIFTRLFLPGFDGSRFGLAVRLFRVAAVATAFLVACTITTTYLQWDKKFFTVALSDFAYKSTILIILILFASTGNITIAAVAVVVAALIKFLIQWMRVNDSGTSPDYRLRDRSYVRRLLAVSWLLLIGNLFSQVGSVAHNAFASYLEAGTLSALSYAKKIIDLPVVVFPYTLSIIVFPFFSQQAIAKDTRHMHSLFNGSLRYIILFFVPMTLFFGFFAQEIVRVFFERGAFDATSTAVTSAALEVYNVGLLAFSLETILVIYLFANRQIKLAVGIGVICVLIDILLTSVLIRSMGYLGIAWGFVLSRWIKVGALLWVLRKEIDWRAFLSVKRGSIILGGLAGFAAGLWIMERYVFPAAQGNLQTLGLLAISAIMLFGGYFYLLYSARIISLEHEKE